MEFGSVGAKINILAKHYLISLITFGHMFEYLNIFIFPESQNFTKILNRCLQF